MELIIGNQNYSSWSLRPWLLLKHFCVEVDVHKVSLNQDDLPVLLEQYSPSCKVPVLIDGETRVWDTLAICEYINEKYLSGKAWPLDLAERARARAIVCEIHSGLMHLRNEMPMNCRASRKVKLTAAAMRDVARVDAIWSQAASSGWLFDEFSIADCFYAPVVFRFHSYPVYLSEGARDYGDRLLHHPAMQAWFTESFGEEELLEMDEVGEHI